MSLISETDRWQDYYLSGWCYESSVSSCKRVEWGLGLCCPSWCWLEQGAVRTRTTRPRTTRPGCGRTTSTGSRWNWQHDALSCSVIARPNSAKARVPGRQQRVLRGRQTGLGHRARDHRPHPPLPPRLEVVSRDAIVAIPNILGLSGLVAQGSSIMR